MIVLRTKLFWEEYVFEISKSFYIAKAKQRCQRFFFFFFPLGLNIQRRKDIREVLDIKDEEAFPVYRGL